MPFFCSITKLGRAEAHILHGRAGGCRHRAHGTPAAHCRHRSAHRGGQSGSTTADVLPIVALPLEYPGPLAAAGGTVPSAWADGPMPASGAPHVRCPLPSPIRPSKRPLPIHSTRCATCHGAIGSKLHHSSTPGQLPDRPVGLGRRADTRIGPTARPRPIAVADSPIEAATPDPQHPLCLLHWYRPP